MKTVFWTRILIPFALFTGLGPALSAAPVSRTSQKLDEAKKEEPSAFHFGFNYSATTDLSEKAQPPLYNHRLDGALSYNIDPLWSVEGRVGAAYVSAGREVRSDSNTTEMMMNDVSLGLNRQQSLNPVHSVGFSLGVEIPTSTIARYEGYKSIFQVSARHNAAFQKGIYNWSNTFGGFAIANEYYYSPASNTVNSIGGLNYSMGASIRLNENLKIGASAGVRTSRYTDSSQLFFYRNNVYAAVNFKALTASFFYTNGTFAENEDVSLWFIDKYRRIVGLSVSLSF